MRKRDVCKLAGIIFVGEPGLYIVVKSSAFAIRIPSAQLGRGGGRVPLVCLVQKWLATFYLIIKRLHLNSFACSSWFHLSFQHLDVIFSSGDKKHLEPYIF